MYMAGDATLRICQPASVQFYTLRVDRLMVPKDSLL